VLLHLAEHKDAVTSEELAKTMGTNPVVIRRVLAGLRESGFVRSQKGHGGGWMLARDLREVTLRDVYDALGRPGLFAMGNRTKRPGCLVERAVNAALDTAFREAEARLLSRFAEITLAALSADFHARFTAHAHSLGSEAGNVHE
jgi:Rrf2 family protein